MSIRLGVLCPSEIAFRRFLPSLQRVSEFSFAGIAIATPEEWTGTDGEVCESTLAIIERERTKAQHFVENFGGKVYEGYYTLLSSPEVDVVYIPLPPALHFQWAKSALENGKHAYVEKPFTVNFDETKQLLAIAKEKKLAVHENYMFVFHNQLKALKDIIDSGEIGIVRQYRISFGFPRRAANDFRYNKALGGGALLDAGGYCLKFASLLLGDSARMVCANACYEPEFEVDIFGSCTMNNDDGIIVQMAFGMDCDYKCELEAWGSTGTLTTGRVLTAPDGFVPEVFIKHNQDGLTKKLPADNAFEKSIRRFHQCLISDEVRMSNYQVIERQSAFLDEFIQLSHYGK